jgi:two-component system, OmpR family, phosphate regulon sensor histidine kinase PhoR
MNKRELRRKARIAELLLAAARTLGETLEPDRVYDRFHDLLADVVPHDGVVVSSYDDGDGLMRCEYAWSDGNRVDPSVFPPLPLNREGGGMQSRVIVTGQPLLFNDVAEVVQQPGGTYYDVDREGTIRKVPESGPPGSRAAMMVPVKYEGRVVGVVQVMSDSAEYTAEELELVDGLVGQMAAAVRNARLQKEQRRLEAAEAAARATAAEREQAASVLDAVGDGIFLVDGDGNVRLWNRAAGLVTGLSAATVCGRPVEAALPDWHSLVERIPVAEHGAAIRTATLPVSVGRRDLWLSFVAVRHADGIVYAFRDLTSERRLEEEKSDLVATISHELRTPMAAVYGAAQTLLSRGGELDPERSRELLEMVVGQATRLTEITEAVLLATQLDRGTLALDTEPVDVGELARATIETMRVQLPAKARLELEVAPGAGAAAGAGDRIQQVLVNLLDNAVKYGGDGPITVRVEPANGAVRVLVADSGPGIPYAEQERIFEKFYRSGPELTRAPGGTGLGLFISRELVRRMGGRLHVRSEPGAGATFVVELPRPQVA